MLRIVVLHEAVVVRINIVNKRFQGLLQNFNIHRRIHLSLKNTKSSRPLQAYTGPHMYFQRVLRSVRIEDGVILL